MARVWRSEYLAVLALARPLAALLPAERSGERSSARSRSSRAAAGTMPPVAAMAELSRLSSPRSPGRARAPAGAADDGEPDASDAPDRFGRPRAT